ncbi:MAG: DUF5719 family protein [Acidimicrobiales bacterium]
MARLPILLAVATLLVVGGLVDRAVNAPAAAPVAAGAVAAVAAPAAALSSSWFCGGATSTSGAAPGQVVVANAGRRAVTAVMNWLPAGSPATSLVVPAGGRIVVPEQGTAPWLGAIVDLDGGAASVEQQISAPSGLSASPCATSGSTQWYFTTGETLVNASMGLTLINPYPSDAIADLSFSTDQGLEAPTEFQGLVVPAGSLLHVDVGSHLRRRRAIATRVNVRSGRVVAWKTEVVTAAPAGAPLITSAATAQGAGDPADPVPGVTNLAGAPSAGLSWSWPDGVTGDGFDERYVILNPGTATAQLQLAVGLDQGSAEPFTLSVGPGEVGTVVSSEQARIPAGVGHSAVLRSLNGVPVVAERAMVAAPPSSASGRGELLGAGRSYTAWILGGGLADAAHAYWVVLFNPGTAPATATISTLGGTALPGLSGLRLAPGARSVIRINDHAATLDQALQVTASQPVEVERDLYGVQHGVALSLGVPVASG